MVWRVYRSYHKVHSAGWGNVWCSHCDWREQPPLLILLALLHDISGKDIPPLQKPSLVLSLSLCFLYIPPFLTLHSPLSVHRATPAMCPLFLSPSFLSPRSLPPASLFLPTNLHLAPTNMAVFGFVGKGVGACGRMGWGPRLSPWRSTSKHSNEGGVRARSHVSSRIVTVRAGGESDGNTGTES